MFVAIYRKDTGELRHFTKLDDVEPVPDEMFSRANERPVFELWCHYYVNNGKTARWLEWQQEKRAWFARTPPNIFVLAVEVAK